MNAWEVSVADVELIALGAGVLGTGGGGNTYLGGLELARELRLRDGSVEIVDVDTLADDALVCAVSGMGAPTVGVEKLPSGGEAEQAVRSLESHLGRRMDAVVIGEIGGANALAPLVAGLKLDLPVVDGDGMGRAFPELQMDTFSIGGVPAAPFALSDAHGSCVVFDRVDSALRAEAYARQLTIAMGGSAMLVMPVMSGRQAKRHIIRGTLSLARDLGRCVLEARRDHTEPAGRVAAAAGGTVLSRGKIIDLQRRTADGFAQGRLKIAAFQDNEDGLEIEFRNENLVARRGGRVACSVPDLITVLSLDDGEPIGTEMLRGGLRVAVIAMPAPKELKTPAALKVVGPEAFGYNNATFNPLPGNLLPNQPQSRPS